MNQILKYIKPMTVFLMFHFSITAHSQNLLPNPGFEIHDTCPNNIGQLNFCLGWNHVEATPDYFNSCAGLFDAGIPKNGFGFQNVHSGCAYIGLYAYDSNFPNYREYVQSALSNSLIIGQKYFFSYSINLFNGYGWCSGTNRLGFRLSTIQYTSAWDTFPAMDNYATFAMDSIITDTLNWTKISGSFTADSAYTYITFGNFFNDSATQFIIIIGAPRIFSYYYIDDVCLSSDSNDCISVTSPCYTPNGIAGAVNDEIVIGPNPFNDRLYFTKNTMDMVELILYDVFGNLLVQRRFNQMLELNTASLSPGIYFYDIRGRKGRIRRGKLWRF